MEASEASEAKTELVSPSQAHIPWGDNSPLLGPDSPFEEVFFRKTSVPEVSTDNCTEPKQITDGFLSEVSTPDQGTCHKKRKLSLGRREEGDQSPSSIYPQNECTKDKDEERPIFDITPPRARIQTSGNVSGREEFKGKENDFSFSRSKVEEVLQDLPTSTNILPESVMKEESHARDRNICEASYVPFNGDARSQTEVERGAATTLKRKYLHASEAKLQRKRFKATLPEKCRTKGTAQWSHLSEEELKKLRRVKNRESVERCRTKQRLRMEALQVEQTCLRLENKNLREATNSIRAALEDVSEQITSLKSHIEIRDKEDGGKVDNELRREIHA